MQDFKTKILVCRTCKEEFVFTADAQRYFEQRHISHSPKLCKQCHIDLRQSRRGRVVA